jgi:hypothetical protein
MVYAANNGVVKLKNKTNLSIFPKLTFQIEE